VRFAGRADPVGDSLGLKVSLAAEAAASCSLSLGKIVASPDLANGKLGVAAYLVLGISLENLEILCNIPN
jgi:hypothetical protein